MATSASDSRAIVDQANHDLVLHEQSRTDVHDATEHHARRPKRIGIVSAGFIIFNRMIGTGIFATPSTILRLSGSVGLSLVMWVIGAVVASAGLQVYIIWGAAIPRNGGEKNYLEYLFPKPPRLATSIYAANAVLLAWSAGNALVFAEYTLASVYGIKISPSVSLFSPVRLVAFVCLTGVVLLHGLHSNAGLRFQNILGFLKIGILCIMVVTGVLALRGDLQQGVDRPNNFESWQKIWEGSRASGTVICSSLFYALYGYVGFSNANYALGETENPGRTLRIAGSLAIVGVTIFYLFCNIAYFAAATKEEITGSGRLVAALLFRNVWGEKTERVLNAFVALSSLGNVLSVSFSYGRVNQELGKEGVLPFSTLWASSWPARAPLAGLSLHWLVCILVVFALPQGDAFNFALNLTSYPMAVINATISFGLLYVSLRHLRPSMSVKRNQESPTTSTPLLPRPLSLPERLTFAPSKGLILGTTSFGVANIFLVVVPFVKPPDGAQQYEHLPYWAHAAGGWGIFLLGYVWWWSWYRDRV